VSKNCIIIGAGPAGLFAAECISRAGFSVHIYDRKPSVARKFLMAGRGGLNLTHSENLDDFIKRYGDGADWIAPMIHDFTPQDLRQWCDALGEESFIGSSGRVFPKSFKASPLLRQWLARLAQHNVVFHLNQDWRGWDADGALLFRDAGGVDLKCSADATILALGGASWPRLGADGGWVPILRAAGVAVRDLVPVNCGFQIPWSDKMRQDYAGVPIKTAMVTHQGISVPGDLMVTQAGIEGGPIYALSAAMQSEIQKQGTAQIYIDLRPGLSLAALTEKLSQPRGGLSFTAWLTRAVGLSAVARGLLYEVYGYKPIQAFSAAELAQAIKAVPLTSRAAAGMDRAISVAGGVSWDAVGADLMLKALPGVFVAGEMLDWQAPTGGYLLQGCFSTAYRAAAGVIRGFQSVS